MSQANPLEYELRRANEILKAASVFRDRARRRPSEVSAFIDEHRERFGVEPICGALDVSASAYYQRGSSSNGAERDGRASGEERGREPLAVRDLQCRRRGNHGQRRRHHGSAARRVAALPRSWTRAAVSEPSRQCCVSSEAGAVKPRS
jgi:hypothetical protein